MKIGVLGGTFDPPHNGHIALAEAAFEALGLDEVMFLPAQRNPLKTGKQTPSNERLEMVRIAISGHPNLSVSDLELVRGGKSYALDTMLELTYARPAEYWFILGTDALKTITSWKQPEKLVKLCRLGVALRSAENREQLIASLPAYVAPALDWVPMTPVATSSSELRQRVMLDRPVGQWVDPAVIRFIQEKKLYRQGS
jgi:nicotinate-nucleotide adenylyltransferase